MDTFLYPLMIHENYISICHNRINKDCNKEFLDIISDCSENFSIYDHIQNFKYRNNDWSLEKICMIHSAISTKKEINKLKKGFTSSNNIKYTSLLGKISQYHKSVKKINNVNMEINIILSSDDLYYIVEAIRNHIISNEYHLAKEIMKEYKIDIEKLETLIKVNKFNTEKFKLNAQIRKVLEIDFSDTL